jgi:hypothetical protein
VQPVLAAREADDVAFLEPLLTLRRAERRVASDDDQPLLVGVMRVVRPEPITGLELIEAAAEELCAHALAHPRVLAPPAGAILLTVPFVAVEVEDLHRLEPRS